MVSMIINYTPRGVCADHMTIDVQNGIIVSVDITGGCRGNIQGISKLIEGMSVETVISKLSGIMCGRKKTSCPDQIAAALQAAL